MSPPPASSAAAPVLSPSWMACVTLAFVPLPPSSPPCRLSAYLPQRRRPLPRRGDPLSKTFLSTAGVSFAPHRSIDVQSLGADFYAVSCYKVYGPHLAALYGRPEAWAPLQGPNHFFVPSTVPARWELGGLSHEACAGWVALQPYIGHLAARAATRRSAADAAAEPLLSPRGTVVAAFAEMERAERPLLAELLRFLRSKRSAPLFPLLDSCCGGAGGG